MKSGICPKWKSTSAFEWDFPWGYRYNLFIGFNTGVQI